jgi:CRISPR-associated protein Cmr6
LSRATALENAGIALHPLYGFAYLPGSGLKGAARAYAETVWLPAQSDQVAASQQIIDVFGCAPGSERDKEWLPAVRQEAEVSQAGAVAFHDAWPETWPKLFVDIAAIHHPKYYQGSEPPGDWETPSLVSFLAIPPDINFRFSLAPRMGSTRADLAMLTLTKTWLNGALNTLGIGAKTSAGYGQFRTESAPALPPPGRAEARFDLTLVTPAFLAGAAQAKEDCDLRGATLRGQLRWWWRAMHAGHLETAKLRRLEAAIWGASSEGSAVQITLTATSPSPPIPYEPKDTQFKKNNAIPQSADRRRVQGFAYLSYGMAEKTETMRHFRQPGDAWSVRLTARPSLFRVDPTAQRGIGIALDAATVLAEATAALWLLTQFGGVGAKGRKGFGSLADITVSGASDLASVKLQAARLRQLCRLSERADTSPRIATLERLQVASVQLGWTNPWYAINAVGICYQDAVKNPDLKTAKELLGLPRKGVKRPMDRLASAMHLHLSRAIGSGLIVRVATFDLPGINPKATQFLSKLRGLLADALREMATSQSSGHADLYPPRRGVDTAPQMAPAGVAPGRPASPPQLPPSPQDGVYVGQRGHDLESGQSVEVRAIKEKQLRVLFIDEDEEDDIPATNFRPARRR